MSKQIEQPVFDAVILDAADHVATALRSLSKGETVRVGGPDGTHAIIATEAIPLCHKIAVKAVKCGDLVLKYGYFIGDATRAIEPGQHVHIHNIETRATKQKE